MINTWLKIIKGAGDTFLIKIGNKSSYKLSTELSKWGNVNIWWLNYNKNMFLPS